MTPGPDDTIPPSDDPTSPGVPPSASEVVIVAGQAQLAVSLALAKVNRDHAALEGSILELEATATACARALDQAAPKPTTESP
jgi:hypothetical protein